MQAMSMKHAVLAFAVVALGMCVASQTRAQTTEVRMFNTAKQKLMESKPIIGGAVYTSDPNIYCAMAHSGFDFLWNEMQHSPLTYTDVATMILSNVNRDSFAASSSKLGVAFDAIYTAEDIGSYKPNPANFEYLLRRLREAFGLEPADVLHTAQSLFHDHAPAKTFGLANMWIDRQRLSEGGSWGATAKLASHPETDFVFFTMGEMADAVREETGG